MRELYERILQSLFEANHLSTTEEQARYLENLRPAVVRLWDAYQRQEGIQNATHYDDLSTQAAYLLRYFPSYTQPIRETLLAFAREITSGLNVERVRVAFFGSGPAPELFGLLQFLRSNASAARIVEARLYDVAAGPWLPSREINLNRLVPLAWGVNRIETQSVELDLSRPNGIRELGGLDFSVLHLAVFQNCLNEIAPNSYAAVCENIAQLLRFMPTGSLLIIIERENYPAAKALLATISVAAQRDGLCRVLANCEVRFVSCRSINDSAPALVLDKLFVKISGAYRSLTEPERGRVLGSYVDYVRLVLQRT